MELHILILLIEIDFFKGFDCYQSISALWQLKFKIMRFLTC